MCGGRTGGGDESRRFVGQDGILDGILRRVGNPPAEGWRAVEPMTYSRLSRVLSLRGCRAWICMKVSLLPTGGGLRRRNRSTPIFRRLTGTFEGAADWQSAGRPAEWSRRESETART